MPSHGCHSTSERRGIANLGDEIREPLGADAKRPRELVRSASLQPSKLGEAGLHMRPFAVRVLDEPSGLFKRFGVRLVVAAPHLSRRQPNLGDGVRERRVERGQRLENRRRTTPNLRRTPRVPGRIGIRVCCGPRGEHYPDGDDPERAGEHRDPPFPAVMPAYHSPVIRPETLRVLPKAELHLHLDGCLRPETAVDLAPRAGMTLTLEEARGRLIGPVRCGTQAELLTYFDLPIALMQTPEALERVAAELVETLAADGVTYAEVRWAPRLHLARGMRVGEVIEAVARGVTQPRATGGAAPRVVLIVTAMRSHDPAENVALASEAASFGGLVVGFDLAGPEATYAATPHRAAFELASSRGLHITAHAGEVPGSQRVAELLDLGVTRIAHGVTAARSEALLAEIRARDVTLDLCPTSNVQAGIVDSIAQHPVRDLHRAGVSVTISTDDRTVSDVSLTEELATVATETSMARGELASIALNAFARGFDQPAVLRPLTVVARDAWDAWAVAPG